MQHSSHWPGAAPSGRRWILRVSMCCLACSQIGLGGMEFTNETTTRIDPGLAPLLFTDDIDEEDYAWGDLDKDGDDDLRTRIEARSR